MQAPNTLPTRRSRYANRRRTYRKSLFAASAVVAVGLVAGSGFIAVSTVTADQNAAAASSAALARSQLLLDTTAAKSRAVANAQTTIAEANVVVAGAQAKVDTAPLATSIATLSSYSLLDPQTVDELTTRTKLQVDATIAASTAADGVAAAAAAQAAADAQAAAEAAAKALAEGNTVAGAKATAQSLASSEYGWGSDQFSCLVSLWQKESGWSYTALNASSGAAGIPQALPGSKMATIADDWQTNATTQITWGLRYISASYGTPCSAWSHSQSVNWY